MLPCILQYNAAPKGFTPKLGNVDAYYVSRVRHPSEATSPRIDAIPYLEVDLRQQVHTDQLPRQPQDACGAAVDDVRRADVDHLQTCRLRRREGRVQVLRRFVEPERLVARREVYLGVGCQKGANKKTRVW